jgi:hypothetical protein
MMNHRQFYNIYNQIRHLSLSFDFCNARYQLKSQKGNLIV